MVVVVVVEVVVVEVEEVVLMALVVEDVFGAQTLHNSACRKAVPAAQRF